MLISVVSAGTVPEYSVVRYHIAGDPKSPYVGYILRGDDTSVALVTLGPIYWIDIDVEDFVELIATPAATACFYMGNSEECK